MQTPTPIPIPTPTPRPTPTPEPEYYIEQTEGNLFVAKKYIDKSPTKYALFDENEKPLTDFIYDQLELGYNKNGELLISAKKDNKCVLMNSRLDIIVDRDYNRIVFDKLGRIYAENDTDDNIYGIQRVYLNDNYDEIKNREEFLFSKMDEDHKFYIVKNIRLIECYLIGENGETIYGGPLQDIKSIRNGLYLARHNAHDTYEVINADGKPIGFSSDKELQFTKNNSIILRIKSDSGYTTRIIDNEGNELFCGQGYVSAWPSPLFNRVYYTDNRVAYSTEQNKKYALISISGELLTDFIYDKILGTATLSDGYTETQCYKVVQNGEIKYLDENINEYDIDAEGKICYDIKNKTLGDTIIANIDDKYAVTDGIANINDKYALIDSISKTYIIPYTEGAKIKVSNGVILYIKDGKTTIIDEKGTIINETDDSVSTISNWNDSLRRIVNGKSNVYLIDENGENIFTQKYDYLRNFINDNTFIAKKENNLVILKRVEYPFALYNNAHAYINGFEIPCFTVDGDMVINAEDLGQYGFDVIWDGENRTLNISRNPEYYNVNFLDLPAETSGIYAELFAADIAVYFNDKRIGAYFTQGKTFIKPDTLKSDGITFEYNSEQNSVYLYVDGLEQR